MTLSQLIPKLKNKESLTAEEMRGAMEGIMAGRLEGSTIKEFLVLLREKGETAAEIASAAEVAREHAVKLSRPYPEALDTCGTGGDASGTLKVSTLAALTACAAGAKVAKHGNRAVSSVYGSADLLEDLDIRIDLNASQTEASLAETGFAFLLAPNFHPAMRHVAGVRKQISGRTIFNLLGPLINPARVGYQIVGVYEKQVLPLAARALVSAGARRVLAVHSRDGLDEIALSAVTDAFEASPEGTREFTIELDELNLTRVPLDDLRCDSKEKNLSVAIQVLEGIPGPALEIVALNAGFALHISGNADSPKEGIVKARQALQKGKVRKKVDEIVNFGKKFHDP